MTRAQARFVGVPPHAFTSPSRAIDYAVSIPIGRVASVGPMPQGDPPHGPLRPAAIRRNAKKRLPPYLSALRALLIQAETIDGQFSMSRSG